MPIILDTISHTNLFFHAFLMICAYSSKTNFAFLKYYIYWDIRYLFLPRSFSIFTFSPAHSGKAYDSYTDSYFARD